MKIIKYRSSKQLKEAMENLSKVIDFETDNVDVHSEIDIVMADAYADDLAAEENKNAVIEERTKEAEDVILDAPEAPMDVKTDYTEQLKLDESIEDFKLHEDGRKHRIAARDENDTDLYLDYDMLEFVAEVLSAGSKGITNISPKTPIVTVYDKKGAASQRPMKRFSPNGSQVINKGWVALLDLPNTESGAIKRAIKKLDERELGIIKRYAHNSGDNEYGVESMFEDLCDEHPELLTKVGRDALGYAFLNQIKTLSTPQISESDNDVVIYSDDLADFDQVKEGMAQYNIKCGDPKPKRSKLSHWDYNMTVYVPKYSDGEPMMLEDWLEQEGFTLYDIFDTAVANRFAKQFKKADAANAEVVQKVAADKAARDLDIRKKELYDEYTNKAFYDPDLKLNDVYAEMCAAMEQEGILCDDALRTEFFADLGGDFEDDELEELPGDAE